MNERAYQFTVGVVFLATLIIVAILIVSFGEFDNLWTDQKEYVVKVPQAPGIAVDTPVRKSGVRIGRVKKIVLDEASREVLLTTEIDNGYTIFEDDVPRVKTSLLGDSVVEFVRDPSIKDDSPIKQGAVIEGIVLGDPLELIAGLEQNFAQAAGAFEGAAAEVGGAAKEVEVAAKQVGGAGGEVEVLARRLNNLLADEGQLTRVMKKTEVALDDFGRAVDTFDDLVGDPKWQADFKDAFEDLPELVRETQLAMTDVRRAAQRADANLQDLQGFTRPLGEQGDEIVGGIQRSVNRLEVMLDQVSAVTESISSSDGSLGRFLNDPDLYQNLNRAAENLEEVTWQLKPILSDVRVFTDKVARDPSRLGVGGAIRQYAPIK